MAQKMKESAAYVALVAAALACIAIFASAPGGKAEAVAGGGANELVVLQLEGSNKVLVVNPKAEMMCLYDEIVGEMKLISARHYDYDMRVLKELKFRAKGYTYDEIKKAVEDERKNVKE